MKQKQWCDRGGLKNLTRLKNLTLFLLSSLKEEAKAGGIARSSL